MQHVPFFAASRIMRDGKGTPFEFEDLGQHGAWGKGI